FCSSFGCFVLWIYEKQHLQSELMSLELRHTKQQQLIQRLMNLNQIDERSLKAGSFYDMGDKQYMDCAQIFKNTQSGFYMIKPLLSPTRMRVYCDMTDGQSSRDAQMAVSHLTDWNDYKIGFGDMKSANGEFWLGNDNLHYMTTQDDYTLRINLKDFEGSRRFAVYRTFKVDNEQNHYQLQFGVYTGSAGDALSGSYHPEVQWWASHQGMTFSTRDRDNDRYDRSCDQEDKSGWWFNRCHSDNLNGFYHRGPYSAVTDDGIVWYPWHGWWYSLKSVQTKIRPASFEPNDV
uniref:Fibrinogen-like protein 1 n=1 Tax=Sinocyclocheilus grahami TaxID=75366 RepID=A0A672Q855_SINGR